MEFTPILISCNYLPIKASNAGSTAQSSGKLVKNLILNGFL